MRLEDTVRNSSKYTNIYKEGYDTFKKQWMYLFVEKYPISYSKRESKSCYFYEICETFFGSNDMVLTMTGFVYAIRSSSNYSYTSKGD